MPEGATSHENTSTDARQESPNTTQEFKFASLSKRGVAAIVDIIVFNLLLALFIVLDVLLSMVTGISLIDLIRSVSPSSLGLVLFLSLGYFIYFEGKDGSTPGKSIVDIEVVRKDGGRIGFREALMRNVLRVVDWLPFFYIVGIVIVALTGQSQRIGDLAARTIVIRG